MRVIEANPETGRVNSIQAGSQAKRLGVKAGWIIKNLNDAEFSNDCLQKLMSGSERYTITFNKQDITINGIPFVGYRRRMSNALCVD